ncbi:carboxylic ester hydrolase [soil metagenome]
MRPLELVLVAVAAAAVVWPAVSGSRSRRGIVFGTALVAVTAQLAFEGYRWQLLPLYLVVVSVGVGDLFSMERDLPWWRRVSRAALGLIGLGMMTIPLAALPVPELPRPSGELDVGVATFSLVFPDRPEPYGPQPELLPRRIAVEVWYPARQDGSPVGTWTPDLDLIGPRLARRLGYPGFFLSHTRYTLSHARRDATPLPGAFPVVLYSHEQGDFRSVAVNQAESLASRGFVVVVPDHAYISLVSRLPDGTVFELDPEVIPADADEEMRATRARLLLETMAGDLVGILDALSDPDGPFGELATHIDLGSVGAYGRGAGGGAVLWFCLTDVRCRGALGMNPWVDPIPDRVLATTTNIPMLFMRSPEVQGSDNDGRLRGVAERSEGVAYWLSVEGAEPNDFVVAPVFSPLAERLGIKGPIPPERILAIVDRFLAGFFDHSLLGSGAAALEHNPYPEVSLEVIR